MVSLSFLMIQTIPFVVSPYSGLDHIQFTVTNARQAVPYYCTRFGFKHLAYRGLEIKSREIASYVVFESPLEPDTIKAMADEIAYQSNGIRVL